MSALVLTLAGLAVLIWLLLPSKPPAIEPVSQAVIRACLETLLYRGAHSAELRIQVRTDKRIVRLAKYVIPNGKAGITCEIPQEALSEDSRNRLRRELGRHGIRASEDSDVVHASPPLTVDIGQDLARAHLIIRVALEDVFDLQIDRDCVAYFNTKILPTDAEWLTGVARPASS